MRCSDSRLENRQSSFCISTCPYPHDDNSRQENSDRRSQTDEYGQIISRFKITFTHRRSSFKVQSQLHRLRSANRLASDRPHLESAVLPSTSAL